VRQRWIDEALRLIEESGPGALTTRKVAERAGTTTMGLYTEFKSLAGLVAAVVDEGFLRLTNELERVATSEDAIADLWLVAVAYLRFARRQPDLYAVMFGTASLGGYKRRGRELLQGLRAFEINVAVVRRAMSQRRFAEGDPWLAATAIWLWLHGVASAESAGYQAALGELGLGLGRDSVMRESFVALAVGFGDVRQRAESSVAHARRVTPHAKAVRGREKVRARGKR
jgi:AcrR family transcriptional regulator